MATAPEDRWQPLQIPNDPAPADPGTSTGAEHGQSEPGNTGRAWLRNAMAALAFLAVAAAVVSWDAQYVMVHQVKHAPAVAALEAGIPDAGALIFAALGIALALPGRRALRPRALNVACVIAGVGPGSSRADYEAVGVPFEQRWRRFDEGVRLLKPLLQPGAAADSGTYYATLVAGLSPSPRQCRGIPMWIGSWGSQAGLRRVASLGDGWLASAYNTTPEAFTAAMKHLSGELERQSRPPGDFPNALVTMWTWITDKRSDAERVLSQVVGPLLRDNLNRFTFLLGGSDGERLFGP